MFVAKIVTLTYKEDENRHVIRYAREAKEFIRKVEIANLTKAAIADTAEEASKILLAHVGEVLKGYPFMAWKGASLGDFDIELNVVEVVEGLFESYHLNNYKMGSTIGPVPLEDSK